MMKKIIQQITTDYLSRLPDDESFYRLKDFSGYGFPAFLVRRIQLDLENKLSQSIIVPQTEWADMHDRNVGKAWQKFFKTLQAAAQVPANEMQPLLKNAVSDIIHTLVQPRQTVPDLLFGEKSILSAEEVQNRARWLVVYPHFGQVLTRYMERKRINELERRRCEEIVAIVEKKITKNYSPLQWGQMVRPLFEMTNSPVESDLFCAFFENRRMAGIAQKFKELNTELTREDFVDTLFSFQQQKEGYQSTGKSDQLNKAEINPPSMDRKDANDVVSDLQESDENSDHSSPPFGERTFHETKLDSEEPVEKNREEKNLDLEAHQNAAEEQSGNSTEAEVNKSPDNSHPKNVEMQTESEQSSESTTESRSLNDIFADQSGQSKEKPKSGPEKTSVKQLNSSSKQGGDDSSKAPMWQRFADDEENQNGTGSQLQDTLKKETNDEPNDLERYLEKDEKYFIESLFRGSKESYRQSLSDINREHEWSEAYKLIDQQVFKLNKINMYSSAAVDFTDRLQTYFLERGK